MSNKKKQKVTKEGVGSAAKKIFQRNNKRIQYCRDDCDLFVNISANPEKHQEEKPKTIFEFFFEKFTIGPCCSSRDGDNEDNED